MDNEQSEKIRALVAAAKRVLAANQDAQPTEYTLAMIALQAAVERAES